MIVTLNLGVPLASPHPVHWKDHWFPVLSWLHCAPKNSPLALHGCAPVVFTTSKTFHSSMNAGGLQPL